MAHRSHLQIGSIFAKKSKLLDWRNITGGKAFALHVADSGSIPAPHIILRALPGISAEHFLVCPPKKQSKILSMLVIQKDDAAAILR